MAQATSIEWTDVSWNPVHGCSRVSTGCLHCYAETLSLRRGFTAVPWTERNAEQNVTLKPHKLREPLSRAKPWDKPCRVFVNSMSDLFHEQIPDDYIDRVFAVMSFAPQHTFQILTKRPERMRDYLGDLRPGSARVMAIRGAMSEYMAFVGLEAARAAVSFPLPNVWLGVSIENRKWVGRADILRETPAAVRFISAEPLLGPLVVGLGGPQNRMWPDGHVAPELDLLGIDWLIAGGESGSGHRPFDPQWARDLRDATRCPGCAGTGWRCASTDRPATGECCGYPSGCPSSDGCPDCHVVGECGGRGYRTAFFMKQMGGARPGTALEDLPEDLRIREFPACR